jgi:DNA-binding XRE family transcriptional regulator
MEKKEFKRLRLILGKTQMQMAQLLGNSQRAVESYEQGWRKIPLHIERQALFLVAMKNHPEKVFSCWVVKDCPEGTRNQCPAWEYKCGNLCWFINGTLCHGENQKNWGSKMKICRKCAVFQSTMFS